MAMEVKSSLLHLYPSAHPCSSTFRPYMYSQVDGLHSFHSQRALSTAYPVDAETTIAGYCQIGFATGPIALLRLGEFRAKE